MRSCRQHPEHPQFGLKKLLDALGVRREDVLPLPGPTPDAPQRARAALVSEAMRPARTTERWHRFMAGQSREQGDGAGAGRRRHPGGARRRGRGRGGRAHPARGGGDARPDGGARLARPGAGAPRGRPARHLGPARGGLGRSAARQDRRRRVPRSRHRGRGDALRAGGADGAAEAPAVPARAWPRASCAAAGARSSLPPSARPTSARGWTASTRRWRGHRPTCAPASAALRASAASAPRTGRPRATCCAASARRSSRWRSCSRPRPRSAWHVAGRGSHRAVEALGKPEAGADDAPLFQRRGRRGRLQVPGLARARGDDRAGHAGGRLSGVLSQPRRGGDGAGCAHRRIRASSSGSPTSCACSTPTW